ncbi:TRAP transporter small permease [Sorangium sp. So ce1014]|uniref:TRAP transporter small permease n=1 Tax=Sorangium sp. So ce1014 TaxID=3133326 RepID=UPI003F61EE4E
MGAQERGVELVLDDEETSVSQEPPPPAQAPEAVPDGPAHPANARERAPGAIGPLLRLHAGLIRMLEVVLVAAFAALTLDTLWGVFSRYVLGNQSRWTEELAVYLLVWISLLGAGLAYGEKAHLGVDYFVGKMDPAAQRVAAIAIELLVASFAGFALAYGGFTLVSKTLEARQVSPALGLQVGYAYLAVPISGIFFLTFCIENLVELFTGQASPRKGAPVTDA